MLWLHETHEVIGRLEDDFEALYRDEWLPAVARHRGARLLYYLAHAHGTGVSYRVVTITGLEDPSAWGELAAAVDGGELAALSARLDGMRHDVVGKMLVPLPWALDAVPPLSEVPVEPQEHELTVFMEDTVWPYEGSLERYVEAAGAHYAEEMGERAREGNAILRVESAWRTVHGAGRRREIVLWQKVMTPKALSPLIGSEVPERYKKPGTWMHDALELRDQWESRLLRTASWSPLH